MKVKIFVLSLLVLVANPLKSQNNGTRAAVGAASAVAAIGIAAFQMNQIVELWELEATQYLFASNPELTELTVELNKPFAGGLKWNDVSTVQLLTFNVTYGLYPNNDSLDKKVLLMFLDRGYMTEYGIDASFIRWELLDANEWEKMLKEYLRIAVGFDITSNRRAYVYERTKDVSSKYEVIKEVMDSNGEPIYYGKTSKYIPFGVLEIGRNSVYMTFKDGNTGDVVNLLELHEDAYKRVRYNERFDIVYNEGSFGLFFRDSNKLVQLSTGVVSEITKFLF